MQSICAEPVIALHSKCTYFYDLQINPLKLLGLVVSVAIIHKSLQDWHLNIYVAGWNRGFLAYKGMMACSPCPHLSREAEQVGKNMRDGIFLLTLQKWCWPCNSSIVAPSHTEPFFAGLDRGCMEMVAAWGQSLGSFVFRMSENKWRATSGLGDKEKATKILVFPLSPKSLSLIISEGLCWLVDELLVLS